MKQERSGKGAGAEGVRDLAGLGEGLRESITQAWELSVVLTGAPPPALPAVCHGGAWGHREESPPEQRSISSSARSIWS